MNTLNLNKYSLEVLLRYFEVLKNTGYYNPKKVNNLLVLLYIRDVLYSPLNNFITEDDYQLIYNTLRCILGDDCVLPMFNASDIYALVTSYNEDQEFRATEVATFGDTIHRVSTEEVMRLVNN